MGSCFSKKKSSASSSPPCLKKPTSQMVQIEQTQVGKEPENLKKLRVVDSKEGKKEEEKVKKEIFVIKHRKSHDGVDRSTIDGDLGAGNSPVSQESGGGEVGLDCASGSGGGSADPVPLSVVRTSSCTKEEVDAILIQCGRLSRSSSGKALGSAGFTGSGRRYSGSKRSYDFDNGNRENVDDGENKNEGDEGDEKRHYRRQRDQRRSRSASHGRRRTPSRERELQLQQQQQRSGSRDRASGGSSGGRRASRSPGRRSENSASTGANATPAGSGAVEKPTAQANGSSNRPGKMVSVPASVSSLVMDKSNNGGGGSGEGTNGNASIRRVLVRRNTGASPRSQSPANPNGSQQPSLSRSSSRKAEQSPYRRDPLSEIDNNAQQPPNQPLSTKTSAAVAPAKGQNGKTRDAKEVRPSVEMTGGNSKETNKGSKEGAMENNAEQLQDSNEPKGMNLKTNYVEVINMASGNEIAKPQGLTRSRSSRRSRDFDLNPDAVLNSTTYNSLLLEDIQNFHQKSNPPAPSFSLPQCLSKACSIMEAVADLNSCAGSNLSSPYSGDNSSNRNESGTRPRDSEGGKKRSNAKESLLESVVAAGDDLMEPSFHKYVTVKRGSMSGEEMDEQESSGSNSFVSGSQQFWPSSSSSLWEPNSADSADRWTTSRSNNNKQELDDMDRRRLGGTKRDLDHQQNSRLGRGRVGIPGRGLHTAPTAAAAAST